MKHNVLLIEDEALVAMLLEDTLLELGFSVAGTVSRLEPAIAAVERGGFDVAILDVNLGGQPAYAIADKLRERGVPFVFATGYGARGIEPAYRSVPVLQKPFGGAELEAALRQALEGVSGAVENVMAPRGSPSRRCFRRLQIASSLRSSQ